EGDPLLASVVRNAGPPTRLRPDSETPLERSATSHAPLGPSDASSGALQYARGSTLLPARAGAIGASGSAAPGIGGNVDEDPGDVRAGAPGSSLSKGLPLPYA